MKASTLTEFIDASNGWWEKNRIKAEYFASNIWFRGIPDDQKRPLEPGVYRDSFRNAAKALWKKPEEEDSILEHERQILQNFRTFGTDFVDADNPTEVYFTAQHHGLPTRLLDWTTNPLAALFFAIHGRHSESQDGQVFIMDAGRIKGLPKPHIRVMRDPLVTQAIGMSFWHERKEPLTPGIVAIRPDSIPGRPRLQSSCFTLHMHQSGDCENPTLGRIVIPSSSKNKLGTDLNRLNINQFTIYNDLDHLSGALKDSWGVNRSSLCRL